MACSALRCACAFCACVWVGDRCYVWVKFNTRPATNPTTPYILNKPNRTYLRPLLVQHAQHRLLNRHVPRHERQRPLGVLRLGPVVARLYFVV